MNYANHWSRRAIYYYYYMPFAERADLHHCCCYIYEYIYICAMTLLDIGSFWSSMQFFADVFLIININNLHLILKKGYF